MNAATLSMMELERTAYIRGDCKLSDLAAELADDLQAMERTCSDDDTPAYQQTQQADDAALAEATISSLEAKLATSKSMYRDAMDSLRHVQAWLMSPACQTAEGRRQFLHQIHEAFQNAPG